MGQENITKPPPKKNNNQETNRDHPQENTVKYTDKIHGTKGGDRDKTSVTEGMWK